MHLLLLGGTNFVGRHLVERALAEEHEVTLFNRGHTNPGLLLGKELPLYAPRDLPGFATVDSDRAIAAGLEFSLLDRSIEETLSWAVEEELEPSAGLTPEREAEILEALRRSRL